MKGKLLFGKHPIGHWIFAAVLLGIVVLTIITWGTDQWITMSQRLAGTTAQKNNLEQQMASISAELTALKNEDQYKKNQQLQRDIAAIESTYTQAVAAYEDLLNLQNVSKDTSKFTSRFADALSLLAKRDYTKAGSSLTSLRNDIQAERDRIASTFVIPANVPVKNEPPAPGGFSIQTVQSDTGQFLVDVVAADLASTHVYVDTASSGTCVKDCPVLPLGDYVSRNGAFAGINGSYFCPADYPSCADKKNSFDTLLMNRNKVYFNSENNVYSTVPAVIFGNGFIRFVGASRDWGRDTSIDSMIAMQPLLVSGGTVVFGGNSDPKEGAKGGRSFVANRGNTVYIGVVFNATVAESARVMKAMGMDNALNLDDGGSVALWSGGYKVGPGRSLPNAIVFVRK
jgi:hypothetical protein